MKSGPPNARPPAWVLLALVFLLAAGLRLAGVGYGLPPGFNADEPHHVNVAVSFGRGTLNPGVFKYPTLWMYTLFAEYGVYFLLWSGFGLARTAQDFGTLFVWHPGGFYLLARLLSVLFSLLGVLFAARAAQKLFGGRAGLWAAALLAVSPTLVVSAHAAKPDSMMFCLAALAWLFAVRHFQDGKSKDMLLCGACAGLAASTQYTAAPLLILLPVAAWARSLKKEPFPIALVAWALLAALAAFFIASPFILLDWRSFLRDVLDQRGVVGSGAPAGLVVLKNALTFAGHWAVGGLLLLAGAFLLLRKDRPRAVLLLLPPAAFLVLLALSQEGAWQRYQLAVFPAYAAAAAFLLESLAAAKPAPILLAVLLLPGALSSLAFDRELLLPDTRTLAAAWLEANLPEGTRILSDQEHASPPLRMSQLQVEALLEQTRAENHPRRKYYELMLRSHPGKGFEVVRILRGGADLRSGEWHARWSASGRAVLDVREGLAPVRGARVEVVVLTGEGVEATKAPEYGRFLSEARGQGLLLAEFRPEPGLRRGPRIEILRIPQEKP